MDRDLEEECAHEVDDGRRSPVGRPDDGEALPWRTVAEVGRAKHAVARLEQWNEVPMPPHVVARRHDVSPGGKEFVGELLRQAYAVRGVLAVDDAEIGFELVAKAGEVTLDRPAPGRAEDVADEEDLQAEMAF
jgi:hypothetical protein